MTQITTNNATSKNIQNALNNPFGFEVQNTPSMRQTVANEVDKMLKELRAAHAANNANSVYAK